MLYSSWAHHQWSAAAALTLSFVACFETLYFFYHYTLVLLPYFFVNLNFLFDNIMLMSCKKDELQILWYVKIVLMVQRTGLANIHVYKMQKSDVHFQLMWHFSVKTWHLFYNQGRNVIWNTLNMFVHLGREIRASHLFYLNGI